MINQIDRDEMGITMNSSDDKSEMLRELAIFDYVSGNQSASARRNFEAMMAQDETLNEAVNAEIKLRDRLSATNEQALIPRSNFDALLQRIDSEEQAQREQEQGQEFYVADTVSEWSASGRNSAKKRGRFALVPVSLASSFLLAAIVLSVGYLNLTEPHFNTLSDEAASAQVEFTTLADQGRLAKLTLSGNMTAQQVSQILNDHQLKAFESGANNGHIYVYAQTPISGQQLATWQADARISNAAVFSADNLKQ